MELVVSSKLPTPWGEFAIHGFYESSTGKEHVALTMGDINSGEPVLARIHSECLTGDALFSMRCDCGAQLESALAAIAKEGRGILMYLRQEGRGIGLLNKLKAYELQDTGSDTVEANEQLGFDADQREYGICKTMLDSLGISQVNLMTNNPRKVKALEQCGISVVKRVSIQEGRNPHNDKYLETKAEKLGHMLD